MRYSTPTLILALPALTYAVSLNDFPPRLTDLTGACKSIYTQQIDGCKPSDFSGGPCSPACVHGLNDLTSPLLRNCQGVSGQNIIAAFLAGDGPTSVCTNANAVLRGGSDNSPQSQSQDSSPSTTSTASRATNEVTSSTTKTSSISSSSSSSRETAVSTLTTSEIASSTTSAPVEVSGTATASSITSATSGLLVDTSSAPSGAHTQAATASQTSELSPQESLMKDGSGGGSPFDSTGNLSNSAGRSTDFGSSMMVAGAIAIAAGFFVFPDYR